MKLKILKLNKEKYHIDWLNHALEFIVVVIGILLAFQLNKCSDENKNKKIIKNHLYQIYEETILNKNYLAQSIEENENTNPKYILTKIN